jgi:hypothetical protein
VREGEGALGVDHGNGVLFSFSFFGLRSRCVLKNFGSILLEELANDVGENVSS